MRRLLTICVILGWSANIRADDGIPPEIINRIKAATVFVKVRSGPFQGSGSGFLMQADGETGLIVTNEHVVVPPANLKLPPATVAVVFHSGRKVEMVVVAELVAADKERDLAILRVSKVKDLPKPLDLREKVELAETMPVYMFGFPFGEALSSTKGNPAMTIGKGSISSLREDDRGVITRVQIDGDLNPGNSGGPVVDKKGRLVGVAVAKIKGTNIGLAIPPSELSQMLNGRISGLSLRVVKVENGVAEVEVSMQFIDPLGKIARAAVRVAKSDDVKGHKADNEGKWPALPSAENFDLKIDGQKGLAKVTLKSDLKAPLMYTFQPVYTKGDGTMVNAQPASPYRVEFDKVFPPPLPKPVVTDLEPRQTGDGLAGKPVKLGDLTATELNLRDHPVPNSLFWSEDGRAFFHLDGKGVVRRVRLDGLKDEARLETKKKCSWLSSCSEGLILTVPGEKEAWLLDPRTLSVTNRVDTGGATRVAGHPRSALAYAVLPRGEVAVIDWKRGKEVRRCSPTDLQHLLYNDTPAAVSPDGNYLFVVGAAEQLLRYKIDGDALKFDEASPRVAQGGGRGIYFAPEGRLVCVPSGGGNYPIGGERDGSYQLHVFKMTDLAKPVRSLRVTHSTISVGFDPKAAMVYVHNDKHQFIALNERGDLVREYRLAPPDESIQVNQILVHPDGFRALVLGWKVPDASRLWFVNLAPVAKPDGKEPPKEAVESFAQKPAEVGDLTVTPLKPLPGKPWARLAWVDDAKAFLMIDGEGTVRKLRFPDMTEAARLETGRRCSALSLSAAGPLVSIPELREAWLLDGRTLKASTRIPIGRRPTYSTRRLSR